jgi:hypothetical protein
MRFDHYRRILTLAAIALLILAVAGLSVTASHARYLSKSDPAHIITSIAKMNVAPPVTFAPPPAYTLVKIPPVQTHFWTVPLDECDGLELRQIGLTVSLQHRSPPPFLA